MAEAIKNPLDSSIATGSSLLLKNDLVVFSWLMVGILDLTALGVSWSFWRDAPPAGVAPAFLWGGLFILWLFAIGGSVWVNRFKRIRLEVNQAGARLFKIGPFQTEVMPFTVQDITWLEVVKLLEHGKF